MTLWGKVLILAGGLLTSATLLAAPFMVEDVSGRKVEIKSEVQRVILGEGRQIYLLAAFDTDAPFKRVVGWRDDLPKADFDSYQIYAKKYPSITALPTFGGAKDGTFNIEQALTLKPDLVLMNLESKAATDESRLTEKLSKLGIPVVFIDFREKPFENAEKSIRIMGQLVGKSARAEEIIAFRQRQIDIVTDRLKNFQGQRPKVMLDRAGGYTEECCMSFGDENFGRMVAVAGGINIAKGLIPGTFGMLNPEQIIAARPDVVVVTGANWKNYNTAGGWVGVGPGADLTVARQRLTALMARPAFRTLPVATNGNAHAIWHQFYDSPYQFVAIQALAKWLHPELFKDIDPDATFREFYQRFLPIDYQPGYWVTLPATAG
ncbi:ABC transporter substrate-binding protein [Erwinia pyrifoliae]|uniref:ABC transporter substrate-binding protein n=1 Tax=Erwinia pyrifoliae TaxID=79967 RepID=A0ABY5X725_ERWPY|nr:ABC transporter substrate-binding protein [Erwinia pyrifoliae]AUX71500.1 ABC transporter substrate-binding protein [Erwinia pyrifoliae]MCA8878288.1 ABC transporter substrate-binding protein [Erwinia pyrifoliae]MCT2385973.1 ABC transporter substrate-binding protein [Erwinia pyrifoliae]MCU8588440.1 ABC transporter substrate-binding protein [Erwinia pyrifoliae]UWS33156.1 ABC transporter substrate-binding protein [Erwinia pyrifoliae]